MALAGPPFSIERPIERNDFNPVECCGVEKEVDREVIGAAGLRIGPQRHLRIVIQKGGINGQRIKFQPPLTGSGVWDTPTHSKKFVPGNDWKAKSLTIHRSAR